MSAEAPRGPAKGLPAVVPPSGKFIAQLFLVPFLIVTLVVCFLITINWLVGGTRSPKDFLDRLDNVNPEVRWRGAEELAQYLNREEELAANPIFALELCDRLHSAVKELFAQEKDLAEFKKQQPDSSSLERRIKAFQQTENYVLYLSSCVASSIVPVGAPLLGEMAGSAHDVDPQASSQRRRWAMWNLGKLGDNVTRFDKLKVEQQDAIVTSLGDQASRPDSYRAPGPKRPGLPTRSHAHSLETLGIEKVFVQDASDSDAFLRQLTALAASFWEGTPQESGASKTSSAPGPRRRAWRRYYSIRGRKCPRKAITKTPGCGRANAVLAGTVAAQRFAWAFQQMLDEDLRENFLLQGRGRSKRQTSRRSIRSSTRPQSVIEIDAPARSEQLQPLLTRCQEREHCHSNRSRPGSRNWTRRLKTRDLSEQTTLQGHGSLEIVGGGSARGLCPSAADVRSPSSIPIRQAGMGPKIGVSVAGLPRRRDSSISDWSPASNRKSCSAPSALTIARCSELPPGSNLLPFRTDSTRPGSLRPTGEAIASFVSSAIRANADPAHSIWFAAILAAGRPGRRLTGPLPWQLACEAIGCSKCASCTTCCPTNSPS